LSHADILASRQPFVAPVAARRHWFLAEPLDDGSLLTNLRAPIRAASGSTLLSRKRGLV
jgi:hypothetical protein